MDLVSGIKEAIKLKGSSVVTAPYFISILEDFQAFAEEGINAFAAPKILKAICADAFVQQIISTKSPRKHLGFGIKNAIFNIGNQYGYDQDIVADILKKLLIGTGIISDTKDWDDIVGIQPTKSKTKSVNIQPKAGIKKSKEGKTAIPRNRKPVLKIIVFTVIALIIIAIGIYGAILSLNTSFNKDKVITLDFKQKIELPYTKERVAVPILSNAKNIKSVYVSDWCKVKVKGKKNIIIKCEKNASGQFRTADIVIDADGLKKDLLITQACKTVAPEIKIKNISCDFYAIKDSQRGLEVQYTISSSGYNEKQFQSIITFYSAEERIPFPSFDDNYSLNGQCAIIENLEIDNGEQIVKSFIPYFAMPKLPNKSDNIFVKLNISKFTQKINISLYPNDSGEAVSIYSKDKLVRFQGINDPGIAYSSVQRSDVQTPFKAFDTSLSLWFYIVISLIGLIVITATIANS